MIRSIGAQSNPNFFRIAIIAIIIFFLWVVFLGYSRSISDATEKASIRQVRNLINSSLNVEFATYVTSGKFDQLVELHGSNPFELMAKYEIRPDSYKGTRENKEPSQLEPGWYYMSESKEVIYKSLNGNQVYTFSVVFDFEDVNQSGKFESGIDIFRRLILLENKV